MEKKKQNFDKNKKKRNDKKVSPLMTTIEERLSEDLIKKLQIIKDKK